MTNRFVIRSSSRRACNDNELCVGSNVSLTNGWPLFQTRGRRSDVTEG
jgi:hypothetical protein